MAKAMNLDFSGVKDRGAFNPKPVPEGDYAAVITKVEDAEAKGDGGAMYVFTIKLDKYSQHSYPYRCKIQENQLWKLRNIAVAAGLNVPKKRMKFDPNKIVNKRVGVTMIEDEYEGKPKGEVDAIFPLSELAGGDIDSLPEDTDDNFDDDTSAPQVAGDDDNFDPEDEAESKPKKEKKGKKDKKKKKGDSEENLEELDISDV